MHKKQGTNHPHLLVKDIQQELKLAGINIKELIKQMNIDYYALDKNALKDILRQIVLQVTSSPQYKRFQQQSHDKIKQQIDTLYSSESRKHTYLVDCFKQGTAFPLLKERPTGVFNWGAEQRNA